MSTVSDLKELKSILNDIEKEIEEKIFFSESLLVNDLSFDIFISKGFNGYDVTFVTNINGNKHKEVIRLTEDEANIFSMEEKLTKIFIRYIGEAVTKSATKYMNEQERQKRL